MAVSSDMLNLIFDMEADKMSEQVSLWEQYKSGNYDEVIGIWESNQPINDDWSIRAVMYSYYKLKRFDNCIVVYKKYHEHPMDAFEE